MAEGFEPYHVPQQSRRDKLRVVATQSTHHPSSASACIEAAAAASFHGCAATGLLPLTSSYDPSDLLTCAPHHHLSRAAGVGKQSPVPAGCSTVMVAKEEGVVNLMGLVNGSSSTSSSSNFRNPFLDPASIQDISNNPFLFSSQALQNLRDFDHHGFNNGVFKPEPLSLSLSSHHDPTRIQNTDNNHNSSNTNVPLELNLQRFGSAIYGGGSTTNANNTTAVAIVGGGGDEGVGSRSAVPLGPFTGYASILKGSRFSKPAQQLLEEFCEVGGRVVYAENLTADSSLMESPVESLSSGAVGLNVDEVEFSSGVTDGAESSRKKKSRLISMLDEVYRRYKQYYQQMQAVVTSFEYVAGLGNAAPYANLAVKTMTKHFRCLKNAIMDQLQFSNKDNSHTNHGKEEVPIFRNSNRGVYSQRPIHGSGFLEHQPVWRPQRGLPERAVTVLRAWLFEHFLHPYPTDTDKLMLAKQTGLSRSQVSNWFINARVRLWKPMVEEIHMLETRQAQKASQREDRNSSRPSTHEHIPSANSLASENPSTSIHRVHDNTSKRTRNDVPHNMPVAGGSEEMNLTYDNLPSHLQVGAAAISMAGVGSNGVSLTLGLHQNNGGIGLSEPFPINAAQRFGLGLEGNGEGYVMGAFEAQNRHFGRDVIGGQLLHDFVG
ncbi:Knotted like homeodomain transcription factor [Parasponia andersonii]|uniref:Knotted like homeodomain transcription factor n=1 Tax=Parasponia andersonii TaxID=3476 RepID=A0A2P5CFU7_PARAD|nr:Knotted like homeodomain transcription factor [Parasponia andersonii]